MSTKKQNKVPHDLMISRSRFWIESKHQVKRLKKLQVNMVSVQLPYIPGSKKELPG